MRKPVFGVKDAKRQYSIDTVLNDNSEYETFSMFTNLIILGSNVQSI